MIITIDGPAGSGKSTAARKLAARLEIPYLDTGAMYRAIALAAIQRGVEYTETPTLTRFAQGLKIEVDCGPTHTRVRVDGHDVSEAIRDMAVSEVTPYVARVQAIRDLLVERQRRIGDELGSLVTEGRDQGSVVFPHADLRIVLDASLETRARRRYSEMAADGQEVNLEAVSRNLRVRDRDDSRQWEGLLKSGSAVVVDTTDMSLAEVIDHLERLVGRRHEGT